MTNFIAFDPGKNKCGVLLADLDLRVVLDGKVVHRNSVIELINFWEENHSIDLIVMGNGTSSDYWKLKVNQKSSIPIKLFDERNTTFRARNRYWDLWPRKFIFRLVPSGLMIPPQNLDAIAALVLLEDYLKIQFQWIDKPSFKTWP